MRQGSLSRAGERAVTAIEIQVPGRLFFPWPGEIIVVARHPWWRQLDDDRGAQGDGMHGTCIMVDDGLRMERSVRTALYLNYVIKCGPCSFC